MSEAEIFEGLFNAIQAVMTIFSTFFAIVSGYLVALFIFLGRAPFGLRLLAFVLLTIGLLFLGGTAAVIQTMQEGLFGAWSRLPDPIVPLEQLRNPLPLAASLGISQQEIGTSIGWGIAILVYLAMAYLTFLYRWPQWDSRSGDR